MYLKYSIRCHYLIWKYKIPFKIVVAHSRLIKMHKVNFRLYFVATFSSVSDTFQTPLDSTISIISLFAIKFLKFKFNETLQQTLQKL